MALAIGSVSLFADSPTESMSLHGDPDRAIVMIAGGIGITPFMSMLRSEAEADRPRPMLLLYSNSRPETAAYLDELRTLEQRLDGFRRVATMTEMEGSDSTWDGETRRIDADMVRETSSDLPRPHYYRRGAGHGAGHATDAGRYGHR